MARKKTSQLYTVVCGFNAGDDGEYYAIGDPFDPAKHKPEVLKAALEMDCLEAMEVPEHEEPTEDETDGDND